MATISAIIRKALSPYSTNKNTGNVYEIATILWFGRKMGLSNTEYVEMKPLIDSIAAYNVKAAEKIRSVQAAYERVEPASKPFCLEGKGVVDLRNVTQDDSDGGTGDLVAILEDGTERSISVCEAYGLKAGDKRKCLKNPSCRGFGCGDAEVNKFKSIALIAVDAYENEMRLAYGTDESLWKRKPSRAAIEACSIVAADTAAVFNKTPLDQRRTLWANLFSTPQDRAVPADYICFVNRGTYIPEFYRFESAAAAAATEEPTVEARGIYLHLKLGQREVGKVQVKFNNGIKSAVHSSWNSVVYLDRVFTLTKI